jgi:hypothetical protein
MVPVQDVLPMPLGPKFAGLESDAFGDSGWHLGPTRERVRAHDYVGAKLQGASHHQPRLCAPGVAESGRLSGAGART